jgi:hypothetical protein
MSNLSYFKTTTSWQELTGVSDVASYFTLQNTGGDDFKLYLGTTPNDNDAVILSAKGIQGKSSSCVIDNTANTEKVWVKGTQPTTIAINKD